MDKVSSLQVRLSEIINNKNKLLSQPYSLEQSILITRLAIEENEIRRLLASYTGAQKEKKGRQRYCSILLFRGKTFIPFSHVQFAILNSERELEIIHLENSITQDQFFMNGNQLQIKLLDLLVMNGDVSFRDRTQQVSILKRENRRLIEDKEIKKQKLDICRRKKIFSQIEFNHTYGYATPDACEFQMEILENTPVLTEQSEQVILSSYPQKKIGNVNQDAVNLKFVYKK